MLILQNFPEVAEANCTMQLDFKLVQLYCIVSHHWTFMLLKDKATTEEYSPALHTQERRMLFFDGNPRLCKTTYHYLFQAHPNRQWQLPSGNTLKKVRSSVAVPSQAIGNGFTHQKISQSASFTLNTNQSNPTAHQKSFTWTKCEAFLSCRDVSPYASQSEE